MNSDEYMEQFLPSEDLETVLQLTTNVSNKDEVRFNVLDYENAVRYWSLKCAYEAGLRKALEDKLTIIKTVATYEP